MAEGLGMSAAEYNVFKLDQLHLCKSAGSESPRAGLSNYQAVH